jgi:hypothetical protein
MSMLKGMNLKSSRARGLRGFQLTTIQIQKALQKKMEMEMESKNK